MRRTGDGSAHIHVQRDAAQSREKGYAEDPGKLTREGRNMARVAMRRTAAALALVATVVGMGATGALAQDFSGSTVTTGGGTTGVEVGDVLTLAPGVTISAGDVSNETGVGVVIGGGTSAGSAPGGGTNAAVPE
jgi:hypothetical protein